MVSDSGSIRIYLWFVGPYSTQGVGGKIPLCRTQNNLSVGLRLRNMAWYFNYKCLYSFRLTHFKLLIYVTWLKDFKNGIRFARHCTDLSVHDLSKPKLAYNVGTHWDKLTWSCFHRKHDSMISKMSITLVQNVQIRSCVFFNKKSRNS